MLLFFFSAINTATLHESLLLCRYKNTLQQISAPFPMYLFFPLFFQDRKKKKKEDNLDYAPSSTEITTTTPLLVTSSAGNNAFLIHKNRCKMQHEYP